MTLIWLIMVVFWTMPAMPPSFMNDAATSFAFSEEPVTQPDQIGIRREILSGELLIICRADEQEVSGVHFGYSGDLHFLGIAGRILQCDGVSCGNIQQLAEPFADDNAVVCQCNGLSALSLIQEM